jgi:hypothetical protein
MFTIFRSKTNLRRIIVLIITNNIIEQMRVKRIFVDEVENSALTNNLITANHYGPSIILSTNYCKRLNSSGTETYHKTV